MAMATLSLPPLGVKPLSLFSFSSARSTRPLLKANRCNASLFSSGVLVSSSGSMRGVLERRHKKTEWRRGTLVVCEAAAGSNKKPDSAAKRMRQNRKRRLRNKSRKSEIRTRMRKVFGALGALRKKKDATPEDIIPVEKLIAVAYSKIDKAVRKGVLQKNTGSHRKSRLARRKKALLIYRGWYAPAQETNSTVTA